ncbi:hypothetical protein HDU79_004478 [Rhizoclosmatium sp. JEL0117]|nr:hypothetical protein HDU79_004478 [Rhizoclosmatium sp. JEL0117]
MSRPTTLFCAGFGHRTRARDLAYEFERYGRLVRCDIPAPKSSSAKPYAFVEFEDYRDAEDAYYEMQGIRMDGYPLTIQWAKQDPSRNWRYDDDRGRRGGGRRPDSRDRDRRYRSRSRSYDRRDPVPRHSHTDDRDLRRSPPPPQHIVDDRQIHRDDDLVHRADVDDRRPYDDDRAPPAPSSSSHPEDDHRQVHDSREEYPPRELDAAPAPNQE